MINIRIEYQVIYTDEHNGCAEITGIISPTEGEQRLVVVSVEVDNIELLPSYRVDFSQSGTAAELPVLKVFNPLPGREYLVALLIYEHDEVRRLESTLVLCEV